MVVPMFSYVFPMFFSASVPEHLSGRTWCSNVGLARCMAQATDGPSATMSTRRLGSPHHEMPKKVEVFVDHNFDDVKHYDILYIYIL